MSSSNEPDSGVSRREALTGMAGAAALAACGLGGQAVAAEKESVRPAKKRDTPAGSRAGREWRYEKLTWPEIDDAVTLGKACILPVGSIEQHGPHLPLDVDVLAPTEIARGAGRAIPEQVLVLPPVSYGYTGHVMDFPGTINVDFEHFIHQVLDIAKSLAYHGFKKIILLNGHGSNAPNLDLVARRTNLETTAECVAVSWWQLLTVDKQFLPRWRQSKFPGGCAHACELETSLYLHLDEENVRRDLIKSEITTPNKEGSPFNFNDLFSSGPAFLVTWTSTYTESGVQGEAELGTAEKGRQVYEEAVRQLTSLVRFFRQRPLAVRRDRHQRPPDMPIPWGQRPISQ